MNTNLPTSGVWSATVTPVSSPHADYVFSVTESYQFCVILITVGHILADLLLIKIKINSFRNYVVEDGNTTTRLLSKLS